MTTTLPGKRTSTIITVTSSFNNNCTVSLPPSCVTCHCLCTIFILSSSYLHPIFILSSSTQSHSRICTGRQQYKTIPTINTKASHGFAFDGNQYKTIPTINTNASHGSALGGNSTRPFQRSTQMPVTDLDRRATNTKITPTVKTEANHNGLIKRKLIIIN